MLSLLTFLLFTGGFILGSLYLYWRSLGKPEETFKNWLSTSFNAWREKRRAENSNINVIRSVDLPEAPPRVPGAHDELPVQKSEREEEIERLNKLLGDS